MTNYPPGPWTTRNDSSMENGSVFVIETNGGKWLAECTDPDIARLIESLPEAYEALAALLGEGNPPAGEEEHIDLVEAIDMGRRVLAKINPTSSTLPRLI